MPAAFQFCGYCGFSLAVHCPACGASMPPHFRYCGQCAAELHPGSTPQPSIPSTAPPPQIPLPSSPLAHTSPHPTTPRANGDREQTPAAPTDPLALPASSAQPAPDAERSTLHTPRSTTIEQRRRVAILFADLTGSTAIADRLEAETAYRVVSDCITGLGRLVTDGGGYVVKTLGDGLMALFGAPVAYGDDPFRAAQAGLRMQEWMERYTASVQERYEVTVRLRIGVNYGSVVAAEMAAGARAEYDVLGDSVNVAQRIEAAAEAGTVCVSEPFYRITRGAFEYRDRGAARVKGKAEPLQLYQLVAPRQGAPHLLDGAGSPLVGRDQELALLQEAARALPQGRRGFLALTGGSGMGKTRLLDEVTAELAALGIPYLRGTGTEGGQSTPLELWRSWLLELLPVDPGMAYPEAVAAIREALTHPEHWAWAEWLAALAIDPHHLAMLDIDARERVTRGAIRVFLQHWRGSRAAALLVDEAGLLDPLSLRLLLQAAEEPPAEDPSLLVVLAGRATEAYPPPGARVLPLGPLSPESASELIRGSLCSREVGEELCGLLIQRAGGSPLFLDMMLRAAVEVEDPLSMLASVPDTVYGLVQSQLDVLTVEERQVAASAAVLGRAFAERWLETLCLQRMGLREAPWRSGTAAAPWQRLEARDLLIEERPPPLRELQFRHGALQEVLYEGLLKAQLHEEHARAARVIAAEAEQRPELAARAAWHFKSAQEPAGALPWMLTAAEHAESLFDVSTAGSLYAEALDTAERLEDRTAAARAAAGLALLDAHRGEFPKALERYAQALGFLDSREKEGSEPEPAIQSLRAGIEVAQARVLSHRGELEEARPLLEHAQEILAGATDPNGRREYARCLTEEAHLYCDLGLLDAAEQAGRQALGLAESEAWTAEAAAASAALGRIYPLLGDWPAAEQELRRAIRLAEEGADWQGAAACWISLGAGLQATGRLPEAADALRRGLAHAERIDDREKTAVARMNLGTVLLNRGDWDEAEAAFRGALHQFRDMEHPLGVAASLYNLADTLRWAGRAPEALPVLEEAESTLEEIDQPYLGVHVMVARAELLLLEGERRAARDLAASALENARKAAYESGASLSRLTLARALRALGDLPEAEQELRLAVEGFDRTEEPLEGARGRAELAAVLSAQGDHTYAPGLLREATDTLLRLDASPWLTHLPGLQRELAANERE